MGETIISWATHTVNVVTGCSKPVETDRDTGKRFISPECLKCYAEALSLRRGWSDKPWSERFEKENVHLRPERIREIRKLPVKSIALPPSQRNRIFICSMGDIFHRAVPDSFLRQLWDTMMVAPHIYMLLTKRGERAAEWHGPWPAHIWQGVTCGTPKTKYRIDALRDCEAKVKFVSVEPLLESMRGVNFAGVHMMMVGGESGSGFRDMLMADARYLRDLCRDLGIAFFYKQKAAYVTEREPWLVEKDGTCWVYRQFPGELTPAFQVDPKKSSNKGFTIIQ